MDMRHERPIEPSKPGGHWIGYRSDVVHCFQPGEVWCQDTRARAVTGVQESVALDEVGQRAVGSGVRQHAPQHEGVAAPYPDDVKPRKPLRRIGVAQIEFGHLETELAKVSDVSLEASITHVSRESVECVRDQSRPLAEAER